MVLQISSDGGIGSVVAILLVPICPNRPLQEDLYGAASLCVDLSLPHVG